MPDSRYSFAFTSYVRAIMLHMGLASWELALEDDRPEDDPDDSEPWGTCFVSPNKRVVHLWFSDAIASCADPAQTRRSVVHEFIHATLAEASEVWRSDLHATSALSQPVYELLHSVWRREAELAVEQMARAWAEHLPIPERPEDDADEPGYPACPHGGPAGQYAMRVCHHDAHEGQQRTTGECWRCPYQTDTRRGEA